MHNSYQSPLSIHFVWSPSDEPTATSIVDSIRENLSRNTDKPFSRSVNLPIFYYSSSNGKVVPEKFPVPDSTSSLIFVFTSVNTVGNDLWKTYIESIGVNDSIRIVPIALDKFGLSHAGTLSGLNCIRAYEWSGKKRHMYGLVAIAHEIFRHGLRSNASSEKGINNSLKLFLSHSKHDQLGLEHVDAIKSFIDNSTLRHFFDATGIAPGFSFSDEIQKHICDSTLVAFVTDSYSTRYWCQREMLGAKEFERPILVVNCLSKYEDRIFPASSNVPCLTVNQDSRLDENEILLILSSALIETIRFEHSLKLLNAYKDVGWFDKQTHLIARPPEIRKMLKLIKDEVKQVCYPEPPLYSEEANWHLELGIEAITPLWDEKHKSVLEDIRIGISISERNEDFFSSINTHTDQLTTLSQALARHLLARSGTLIYGGDLRNNGFTEFILDEAHVLSDRLKSTDIRVENYLAWPLYLEDPKVKGWRAQHHNVMKTIEIDIPDDIANGLAQDVFIKPTTPQNLYIWSRCLTRMREDVINSCDYRICAGGKASGYKGKMPGVLEEIVMALDKGKPLFLLGGLCGITGDVCKLILGEETPVTLDESWQKANNAGYTELQNIAKTDNQHCDYVDVVSRIRAVNVKDLAKNVNLSESEYKILMQSPYTDECLHLVLKSLSKSVVSEEH